VASGGGMNIIPEQIVVRVHGIALGRSGGVGEAVSGTVAENSERSRPDIDAIYRGHESLPCEGADEAIKIVVQHLPVSRRGSIQRIYSRRIARIFWNIAE